MTDCNSKEETTSSWSLNLIEIPKPCEVPWDSMQGSDRVRFCAHCSKNVYNISDMSEAQATKLLVDNEGKVCISMLRRADGTIVTDNCPSILRPVRNSYKKMAAVCSAFIALACNQLSAFAADSDKKSEKGGLKASTAKDKDASEKQVKAPNKNESICNPDTLIIKHEKKNGYERLGGVIAPPQAKVGSGPIGSRIEVVGYDIDDIAKSSYPEEFAKQICKQWHPSSELKTKEVVISLYLDHTGKVYGTNVARSSGDAAADVAAESAVKAAGPFKLPTTMQQRVSCFNVKFPLK